MLNSTRIGSERVTVLSLAQVNNPLVETHSLDVEQTDTGDFLSLIAPETSLFALCESD